MKNFQQPDSKDNTKGQVLGVPKGPVQQGWAKYGPEAPSTEDTSQDDLDMPALEGDEDT